jgi:TRAP transporter 4TM/12TM fusion protein
MSLFHLYTGTRGVFEDYLQRSIHLSFALSLTFLVYPFKSKKKESYKGTVLFLLLVFITMGYIFINYDYLTSERFPWLTSLTIPQRILGLIFLLILLEATRRVMGPILPAITLVVIIYALFGHNLPGIFKHAGYSLDNILDTAYLSTMGTFGLPLGVSASYLVLFVLFGNFLEKSGMGAFIMEISKVIAGKSPGGPAKIAVVSSGCFGMISGSPIGNVVTTGSFTIPMMKKVGYKPYFAGAVEAVASTGGMIMPPVMGVLAFVMAEFTGIPYIQIIKHAIIPGFLYYFGVYIMVHYEALKTGLTGLSSQDLPDARKTIKEGIQLIIPIIVLVILLIKQYTPMYAVVYSIYVSIFVASWRKSSRMGWRKIIDALEGGATASVTVALACATAGLISGILGVTGLGLKLSNSIINIVGGNIHLLLILTALVTLLLGCGLPSTVCYIVLIPLVIPALIQMGVSKLASHFFVVYFSTLAFITPPVGLAFYVAAGLAGAPVMKTGVTAVRLGMVAFIVPFLFVFYPSLLMVGKPFIIGLNFITATIGVFALAVGLEGYWYAPMKPIQRMMALSSAILLIKPGIITDGLGIVLVGLLFFLQKRSQKLPLQMAKKPEVKLWKV